MRWVTKPTRNSLAEHPPRPPGRTPDQPLPPPLRDRDRHEWIVVAPLHARERRTSERAHRVVVEIEPARRDERLEPLQRQLVARDGREQRRRHRVRLDLAAAGAAQDVAPPLQTDLTRERLAHDLTHPRDLDIEGIQR